ncbi:MAG TPA: Gfo/Idh/MocA family oxidoreductase [Gaiella sp.]|jgi:predicted dehydrogenase
MTLDVVCAGAGWATGERHLPALARDDRVRVVGVVDPHIERARALAKRFRVPHAGTTLDEIRVDSVSALTIGAPPMQHAHLVEAALARGWHCLCEKPFVLPATRAAELAERARDSRLVVAVVHNFQFSRGGRRLFRLIDSGRLGEVEAIHGFQLSNRRRRLPHWHRTLPGGLFLDEASHLLYLIRRILGRLELRVVDGRVRENEVRDVTATFAHSSVWATLTMDFDASVSEWLLVVVGSEAVAAFDVYRDLVVVLPNDRGHKAHDVLRTSAALVGGHLVGFTSSGALMARGRLTYGNDEVVRRFVDASLGNPERIAGMTADDGVAVVVCLEEVLDRLGVEPEGSGSHGS